MTVNFVTLRSFIICSKFVNYCNPSPFALRNNFYYSNQRLTVLMLLSLISVVRVNINCNSSQVTLLNDFCQRCQGLANLLTLRSLISYGI